MNDAGGFYTMKGYLLHGGDSLSSAMEDYLEMIARLARSGVEIRVNELAGKLHVKASSVTKMVQHLTREGYLRAEKYGLIYLTEKGAAAGEYLLYRHDVLQGFLCAVNHTGSELEQVEKIEHFLDERTIKNLELLTRRLSAEDIRAEQRELCRPAPLQDSAH